MYLILVDLYIENAVMSTLADIELHATGLAVRPSRTLQSCTTAGQGTFHADHQGVIAFRVFVLGFRVYGRVVRPSN